MEMAHTPMLIPCPLQGRSGSAGSDWVDLSRVELSYVETTGKDDDQNDEDDDDDDDADDDDADDADDADDGDGVDDDG